MDKNKNISVLISDLPQSFNIGGIDYGSEFKTLYDYKTPPYLKDKIIWAASNYLFKKLKEHLKDFRELNGHITLHTILTSPVKSNFYDRLLFWTHIFKHLTTDVEFKILKNDCIINCVHNDFLISETNVLIIKLYDSPISQICYSDLIRME